MRVKIIVLTGLLALFIIFAVFSISLKGSILESLKNPNQVCNGGICGTCFVDGSACSCNENSCQCDDKTVPRKECAII